MNFSLSRVADYPAPLRLLGFVALLLVCWLPFVGLIYGLVDDPNTISILTMAVLFVEFVVVTQVWGRRVYGDRHRLQTYGLIRSRQNGYDWLNGVALGLVSLLLLFMVQGWLGWLTWEAPSPTFSRIVVEGLLVATGVGFGEELIFRGWLLEELQRDYSPPTSLWANSLIFAILHYTNSIGIAIALLFGFAGADAFSTLIETLPQFPGLVLLSCLLVWAKRVRRGRLGFPMGLHTGLVWGYYIVNVGERVQYTGRVPEWVTGVHQNPLAGVTGMLFLGVLALSVRSLLHHPKVRNG